MRLNSSVERGVVMEVSPSKKKPKHDDAYERELVAAIARGDDEAWAELHRIYFPKLAKRLAWDLYGVYGVKDHDRAEELAQETLVRAKDAALRFRGDSDVQRWLNGIADNVVRELSRKIMSRPVLPFMPRRVSEDEEREHIEELVQDPKPDPGTAVFAEKIRQEVISPQVLKAIAELERCHPACFEAYKLRYIDGITSLKAIARRLDVRVGTVKSRLSRARHFLRQAVEKEGCPTPFLNG